MIDKNISGLYLIQVSLLLIGQQGLVDRGLCKFYTNAGGKQPIQRQRRQPLLVQCKHQAYSRLSVNNYNPLVISRNDKNKQLTLLSQPQR
jgi:hypothetical protein